MTAMLDFQEQIKKDRDKVFFNNAAKEFVTTHLIGGIRGMQPVECGVVVDYELYQERNIKDDVENISLDGLVLFIPTEEWKEKFGSIPGIGAALRFDGRQFQVAAAHDNMGVLEITLSAKRG